MTFFFFFFFLNLLLVNLLNHSEHINLGSPVVVLRCGRSEPSSETEYGQDAYLATGTLVISMGKP